MKYNLFSKYMADNATKRVYAGKLVAQRTKQAREAQNMLFSALKNLAVPDTVDQQRACELAAQRTRQARALKNPAMVIRLLDEVSLLNNW